jgi:calcium-dependent protein kinase
MIGRYYIRRHGVRTFLSSFSRGSMVLSDDDERKKRNVFEFYEKRSPIQSGRFGIVESGLCKATGDLVAIKTIQKSRSQRVMLKNEIGILDQLDHPTMMKMRDVFEDKEKLYIVTDLYDGDELFDRIIYMETFTESQAAAMFREILHGLNYLHKTLGIAHRDLKPENLMFKNKSDDSEVVLIDFGMSMKISKPIREKVGTAGYVAPEVLDGFHDFSCDMWSLGVILYIVMSGSMPFYGSNENETLAMVRKAEFDLSGVPWEYVSDEAKDLIQNLIQKDPSKRLTAEEALRHEWITQTGSSSADIIPLSPSVIVSMNRFVQMERLKREALSYIARSAKDEEDAADLVKVFSRFDKDNTGKLSFGAANKALRGKKQLGLDLFKELDTDHDGSISLEELYVFMFCIISFSHSLTCSSIYSLTHTHTHTHTHTVLLPR